MIHYADSSRGQRGGAMLVMLVILVIGITTAFVTNLSSTAISNKRNQTTAEALAQAKEALIGKSLAYTDYPGSLPCPDTDDDGDADAIGGPPGECPQYIGRLPWKTLGIPDLRDATGERLWYTLSRNVRRYDSVRPLNSDTPGTLNVTGTYADSNLMAIVFAPGANTPTQSRSTTQTAYCSTTSSTILESNCAANYLEGGNDDPSPGAAPNVNYQNANAAIDFNDQLFTISHDQLFATVEKRVGGEFRRHLNSYHASWKAFPFAAPFSNPSTSNYIGSASTYEGLYPFGGLVFVDPDDSQHPIGSSPTNPVWASSPSPAISFSPGPTPSFTCERKDSDWNNSRVRCTADSSYATLAAGATVTMTAKLKDVGRGFWKQFSLDAKNINVFDPNDEQVRVRDQSGNYQLAKTIFDPGSITVTGTLNYSDGSATVVFSAKGKTGGSKFERIDIRDIEYEQDSLPYWIEANEWGRLLYYAVSPDNAPAGTGGSSITCSPSTTCLILNNVRDDVKAMVITTGRTVAGAHPSGYLNYYLEGQNQSVDYTFENQIRSSIFNDQVIVVAP